MLTCKVTHDVGFPTAYRTLYSDEFLTFPIKRCVISTIGPCTYLCDYFGALFIILASNLVEVFEAFILLKKYGQCSFNDTKS